MKLQTILLLSLGLLNSGCGSYGVSVVLKKREAAVKPIAPGKDESPIATLPGSLSLVSMEPSGTHWIENPSLTISLGSDSKVQLFKDDQCAQAVSDEVALKAGEQKITVSLNELGVIDFHARVRSTDGTLGECTDLETTYHHVRRFVDPNPSVNNGFGTAVLMLSSGNVVVTSPYADINGIQDAGAVYLFNGKTGRLISTLHGSTGGDTVGLGLTALTSGNYVVTNSAWDCQAALGCSGTIVDVGAMTFGSGTTGVSGPVTTSNSLVGSTAGDSVGIATALANGNYVVASANWDCQVALGCSGTVANVGAVTFGSGITGVSGPVTATNSLVGSTFGDGAGIGVTALTNGNYVVHRPSWTCQTTLGCSGNVSYVGAVTFGSGFSGVSGHVTIANSLVGSTTSDGTSSFVTALTNGNYVVSNFNWDCQPSLGCSGTVTDVGAVTFGSGTTGVNGPVTATNSLVGSTTGDNVGFTTVTPLTNGNYVVRSQNWDCQVSVGCTGAVAGVGAVTFGSGVIGVSGPVTVANSLVGSTAGDSIGSRVTALTNGNYVVGSSAWDCQVFLGCSGMVIGAGAVTFGSGTTGVSGQINAANSLIGSNTFDQVGGSSITALTNGNYVVSSESWDCQVSLGCSGTVADVGAVTFGSGTTGINGPVTATNSLIGSTAQDYVGKNSVRALTNGNYTVISPDWDCQAALGCSGTVGNVGAVTFGSGITGVSGPVTASNSLVGSTLGDGGGIGVTALTNGNYVVVRPSWDCQTSLGCSGNVSDVGAVTFGSGNTGVVGPVTAANSLFGSTASDGLAGISITPLRNGRYTVGFSNWDCQVALGCSVSNTNAGVSLLVDPSVVERRSGVINSQKALLGLSASTRESPDAQSFLLLSQISRLSFGILSPVNVDLVGNMYALQGDLDNDGFADAVDSHPLEFKRNTGVDSDGDGYDNGSDTNDINNRRNSGVDADNDGWDSGADTNDSNNRRNSGVDADNDGWDSGTDTNDGNNRRNSGIDADSDGWDSGTDTNDGFNRRNSGIDADSDGWDSGTDINESDNRINSGVDADGDGWDDGIDIDDLSYSLNSGIDSDGDGWDSGTDVNDSDYPRNSGTDNDGDGWDSGIDADDNDPFVQ